MSDYSIETYGERVADAYDEWYSAYDPDAIDFLTELAASGKALELGIGTGRFALPLAAKNVEVYGIDASESMLARLQKKPGAEKVHVKLGDFAEIPFEGKFQLIYVVFNTLFALTSQDAQVRCLRSVAAHLAEDGRFVIEAFVPDPARFTGSRVNWPTTVTTDRVELDIGEHDSVNQKVVSQKVVLTDGNIWLFPIQIRYVWPAELDLMAQLAGLRLRERLGGWRREPFSAESKKHISVYEWAS